jgi:hypothetical protein
LNESTAGFWCVRASDRMWPVKLSLLAPSLHDLLPREMAVFWLWSIGRSSTTSQPLSGLPSTS